jgi:hypothetical protein
LFCKEKQVFVRVPFWLPPQMIGFSLNPSPPIAALTVRGKFGGFLQVVANDSRLMISQVFKLGAYPPQIKTLEKPLKKKN